MFNLAQNRKGESPGGKSESPNKKYEALHKMRMQNREPAIQEDARKTSLMMVQEEIDSPRDAMSKRMEQDEYWQYVWEHDPGYMKEVMRLTKDIVRQFRKFHDQTGKWPPNVVPVSPPPKQQGGPGGAPGGAPPGGGGPPGAGLGGLFGSTQSKMTKLAELSVLSPEKCKGSSDMGCLILTATAKGSHPAARQMALDRLVEIACSQPSLFKDFGFTPRDAEIMAKSASPYRVDKRNAHRLGWLLRLADSDDAEVAEAFVSGDEDDKRLVSRLVASQSRDGIVSAVPEMCLIGEWLNPEFFEKLDAKDESARKVIAKVLGMWGDGNHRLPEDLLTRKAAEAIDCGDDGILSMSLSGPPGLRCLAIGKMLDTGKMDGKAAAEEASGCEECPRHALGCRAIVAGAKELPAEAKFASLMVRTAEGRAWSPTNRK
jgi:hypothetical protein